MPRKEDRISLASRLKTSVRSVPLSWPATGSWNVAITGLGSNWRSVNYSIKGEKDSPWKSEVATCMTDFKSASLLCTAESLTPDKPQSIQIREYINSPTCP